MSCKGAPHIVAATAAIEGPEMFPGLNLQPEGVMRIARRLVRFYFVGANSPSALRGHLVVVWNALGHTYSYGFHVLNTLAVARALDLELVRHLATVYPCTKQR